MFLFESYVSSSKRLLNMFVSFAPYPCLPPTTRFYEKKFDQMIFNIQVIKRHDNR
jgi:hypothetical protein